MEKSFIQSNGLVIDYFSVGMMIFSITIFNVNFMVLLFSNSILSLSIISMIGSFMLYFLIFLLISYLKLSNEFNSFFILFQSGRFFFGFILILAILILIDFGYARIICNNTFYNIIILIFK